MKAIRTIITIAITALLGAALVMIAGEPSDNTWRSFWICMAWKPAGFIAIAAAWYLGKARHCIEVIARARHIAAIGQQQTTL